MDDRATEDRPQEAHQELRPRIQRRPQDKPQALHYGLSLQTYESHFTLGFVSFFFVFVFSVLLWLAGKQRQHERINHTINLLVLFE